MVRIFTFSLPDNHPLISDLERTNNRSKLIRRLMKDGTMMNVYQKIAWDLHEKYAKMRNEKGLGTPTFTYFVRKMLEEEV